MDRVFLILLECSTTCGVFITQSIDSSTVLLTQEKYKRNTRRNRVFLLLLECSTTFGVFITQSIDSSTVL